MNDLYSELNCALYVRSKLGGYPLSQGILPNPDGLVIPIFKDNDSVNQYFEMRGITDPENFEINSVSSIYDFMIEVAEYGFCGLWYVDECPLFFGNYISDVDNDLPSFLYTFNGDCIGAIGNIDKPEQFQPWNNYFRTDKMIRRFIRFPNGAPVENLNSCYSIEYADQASYETVLVGDKTIRSQYVRFPDGSPLHGSYTAPEGSYCVFSDKDNAEQFFHANGLSNEHFKIAQIGDLMSFLKMLRDINPFADIGLNPGSERYLQGYFFKNQVRWILRMVIDNFAVEEDGFKSLDDDKIEYPKKDTVLRPNSIEPSYRGFKSTLSYPLKSLMGTTVNSLPKKEVSQAIQKVLIKSKYAPENPDYDLVTVNHINSDIYLAFGFDKVTGDPFSNNEEMMSPFVFEDILDAIAYFYYRLLPFEKSLRLEGYSHCWGNIHFKGSEDEDLEEYIYQEQKSALENFYEMILSDGYKLEHSELLKSFLNRSSCSLEIELCGYLGDCAVFNQEYLEAYIAENGDSEFANKIWEKAKAYKSKYDSKMQLDQKYQNKLKIYLGEAYELLSSESLLILETSLSQYEKADRITNYDYAGIAMKLCKVFERELVRIIFRPWRDACKKDFDKQQLKEWLSRAEDENDLTTRKLVAWLLKRGKLELGAMKYAIARLLEDCNNDILSSLKDFIQGLKNGGYILSESFIEACHLVSTRYRNGGVHEKIVTYKICEEAFENVLCSSNNMLKELGVNG